MNHPLSFTDEETALLADAQFFRKKARVSEKIRGQPAAVHDALKAELSQAQLFGPPDFDPGRHQFVKGEHLEEFPYQYLDCPKHFDGTEKCTFRTLIWWGHYVVCAWILEGGLIKLYKKNLVDRFHRVAGRGLELSTAPTLWEWKRGEGYTLPITHDRKARIAAVLAERSFIKVARFFPLDDQRLGQGDLAALALEAFQTMAPIVAP
jgi:hypothetical protein